VFHARSHWNAEPDCCDPGKDRNAEASPLPNPRDRRWRLAISAIEAGERPGVDNPEGFSRGVGWAYLVSIPLWLLIAWGLWALWTVVRQGTGQW
jgi:hypothetical protein